MRIDRDTRIAGYIASTADGSIAAGRTVNEARNRAGVDFADVDIDFATVAELDDLINLLPPIALGIVPGAVPWWQEHAPEPPQGLWLPEQELLPDGHNSGYLGQDAPDEGRCLRPAGPRSAAARSAPVLGAWVYRRLYPARAGVLRPEADGCGALRDKRRVSRDRSER